MDWIHVPGVSSNGTYTISWGNAAWFPNAYELEEDVSSSFTNPALVYQGSGHSQTFAGKADGSYYYRVRGINTVYGSHGAWLDGERPEVVDSTLTVPPVPADPGAITLPSTSTSGLIPLSWSSVSGVAGYDVQVSSMWATGGPSDAFWSGFSIAASDLTATSYTHTGAQNMKYRFRVRDYLTVGNYRLYSLWSANSGECSVFLQVPGAVASVTVPASSHTGTYTVSWSCEANSAAYELEEEVSPGVNSFVQIYQGPATSFEVAGRQNGTYSYRVRGINASYQGPYTDGANSCVVSLRGTLQLSLGPAGTAGTELPGAQDVSVLQLTLAADAVEDITVTSISMLLTGSLNPAIDVTGAELYADLDGDARIGAGDVLLDSLTGLTGNVLAFLSLSRTIPASASEQWLLAIDIASGAAVGATFRGSVSQNSDVTAAGSVSATPFVAGAPVQGPLKTVQTIGSVAMQAAPGNPADSEVGADAQDVVMMEINISAGSVECVTINSIAIKGEGSGNEASDVAGACLYLDADGDDKFDPVQDTLLAGPALFAADDGTATFTFTKFIMANESVSCFVVYDFAGVAAGGSQFKTGVASDVDITATGAASGKQVYVSGAPVSGCTITIYMPPPPPDDGSGRCGGGPATSTPGAAVGLALLCLAMLAARAAVRRQAN